MRRFTAALLLLLASASAYAADPALSGRVSSAAEGAMEGVLVSARKEGSPVTLTVVSGADGRYAFPADRLAPGRYALTIRAVGYELSGTQTAEVTAQPAVADLALSPAKDLAAQLTNTEWLLSMPGSAEQKRPLIECMSCHTYERILRSRYQGEAMFSVVRWMPQYANNSTMQRVQARKVERPVNEDALRKAADYLTTVNLGTRDNWSYALKTLPRPKGEATRVIVTEYDLPRREIAPHDVRTDEDGFVWYSDFVDNILGRFDPRTGDLTEFRYPVVKPDAPKGALALERGSDGNWWLGPMFQTGAFMFDVKTKTFRHFPLPADINDDTMQQSLLMPGRMNVDGKVWTNDVFRGQIMRLDVATGAYERFDPFAAMKGRQHSPYGMAADANNNLFFMDFADENVGRVDAKTGKSIVYPTPTPRSRPRRTMMDEEGRVWFAEFAANKVAMFDPRRETIKEWDVPTPHTYPYDVYFDRNGELWSGSMASDRILRFNPDTGKSVEYLLPRQTNIRRIFVDDRTTPATLWAGSNHGASIVKVEPLDPRL